VQAIGRSRGGRTTTIHALTDNLGRPRVLMLAPGNVHDVMMASDLLAAAGQIRRLIADRAYDTNRLRAELIERGVTAVIPSTARRKSPIPYTASSIANAISSNGCSRASRTSAALRRATTSSPEISFPP
jgi:IS5 family transposase